MYAWVCVYLYSANPMNPYRDSGYYYHNFNTRFSLSWCVFCSTTFINQYSYLTSLQGATASGQPSPIHPMFGLLSWVKLGVHGTSLCSNCPPYASHAHTNATFFLAPYIQFLLHPVFPLCSFALWWSCMLTSAGVSLLHFFLAFTNTFVFNAHILLPCIIAIQTQAPKSLPITIKRKVLVACRNN